MSEQEQEAFDLLGRMHLDAIQNGDWEAAARLAEAIESHAAPVKPRTQQGGSEGDE